jgi:hypothetical protein
MKVKEVRYNEAVARNLQKSLKKAKYDVAIDATLDQREKLFERTKTSMGIRDDDNRYDAQLKARLGAA